MRGGRGMRGEGEGFALYTRLQAAAYAWWHPARLGALAGGGAPACWLARAGVLADARGAAALQPGCENQAHSAAPAARPRPRPQPPMPYLWPL